MRKLKLVFGTALAFILAVSLLVPANISAAEEPVAEPAPAAEEVNPVQAAFDAKYPDGIPEGQSFYLSDLFENSTLTVAYAEVDPTSDGGVINSIKTWYDMIAIDGIDFIDVTDPMYDEIVAYYGLNEKDYHEKSGLILPYKAGHVILTVTDFYGISAQKTYTLEFDVTETATDFVLNPSEVTLNVGESSDIMLETNPTNAWWFWEALGADSVSLTWEVSDSSIIDVQRITDEEGYLDGFTATALKAGTATITVYMETEAGDVAVATIKVNAPAPTKPAPAPAKPTPAPTKPNPKPTNSAPATGDTTNTGMYAFMMLVALVSMGGYVVLKKQK